MRYWLCYHNTDERGRLPGDHQHRIDPAQFMIDRDTRGSELCGIYTAKGTVHDAVGDTVFLVVGVGDSSKRFFLWSWFVIDNIRGADDGPLEAYGSQGFVLNPAPELTGSDFDQFKRQTGNFGFGFQDITDYPYVDRLLNLARLRRDS